MSRGQKIILDCALGIYVGMHAMALAGYLTASNASGLIAVALFDTAGIAGLITYWATRRKTKKT